MADFDDMDELFEPFELTDDGAPVGVAAPPTDEPAPPTVRPVSCTSCGSANHPDSLTCVECGARLARGAMPVAPQPMVRSTAGTRALIVMASVIVIVALLALLWNVISGDDPSPDEENVAASSTSTSTTLAISQTQPTLIIPARAVANSQLENFPVSNLIDSDPSTEWQDRGLNGQGATLTFFFDDTVEIESIEFINLADPTRFKRNYRIEGVRIAFDNGNFASAVLDDATGSQAVQVSTVSGTNRVVIDITSTYPAEAVGDQPPFDELALADVQFVGRIVAPAAN